MFKEEGGQMELKVNWGCLSIELKGFLAHTATIHLKTKEKW